MKPIILFRRDPSRSQQDKEKSAAMLAAGLDCITSRTDPQLLAGDRLVIARYSALPFYKETEVDLLNLGCSMINTYRQHQFVANLGEWYELLGPELTPETWFSLEEAPSIPLVVKGSTNSRKDRWATHMMAPTRTAAIDVTTQLLGDGLIADQGLCYRKYIPLADYGVSLSGCPISREYRFFCLDDEVLCSGFYWSSHAEMESGSAPYEARKTVRKALELIEDRVRFVVVDVAQDREGKWWVIELNDGQMSGLSECSAVALYKGLQKALDNG